MSAQLIACLLELCSGLDSTARLHPTMWNPLEARTLQLISCGRSLQTGGPSHRLFPRTLKTKNENSNMKNRDCTVIYLQNVLTDNLHATYNQVICTVFDRFIYRTLHRFPEGDKILRNKSIVRFIRFDLNDKQFNVFLWIRGHDSEIRFRTQTFRIKMSFCDCR